MMNNLSEQKKRFDNLRERIIEPKIKTAIIAMEHDQRGM
jgi:recombinational DNA repair protein RecR